MQFVPTFRISAYVVAAVVICFALGNLLADLLVGERGDRPFTLAPEMAAKRDATGWAVALAPFRGQNHADLAAASAAEALVPGAANAALRKSAAASSAGKALTLAPFESRAWLVLAALDAQANIANASEALRMSYFTAPNDRALAGARLRIVASSDALATSDIMPLARGDVRSLLADRQNSESQLRDIYQTAVPAGRAFIQSDVDLIDPSFANVLRGGR